MLAMSSALGSGEQKKTSTRLVLTLKLTFFWFFFLQLEEDLQAKMSALIFVYISNISLSPHFYGLVFGVTQYRVAAVLILDSFTGIRGKIKYYLWDALEFLLCFS